MSPDFDLHDLAVNAIGFYAGSGDVEAEAEGHPLPEDVAGPGRSSGFPMASPARDAIHQSGRRASTGSASTAGRTSTTPPPPIRPADRFVALRTAQTIGLDHATIARGSSATTPGWSPSAPT